MSEDITEEDKSDFMELLSLADMEPDDVEGEDCDGNMETLESLSMEEIQKITFNEIARIKNLNNTFDEINYEASILNNFSSSMVQKLILEIIKLNDS